MSTSFLYNPSYTPAAPIIELSVQRVGKGAASATLVALVDSGADATLVPRPLLRAIGARLIEKRRLVGMFGTPHVVDTYLVTIQVGSHVVRGVQVVAVDNEEDALVGRDVLNHLVMTLNGPAETIEIEG